MGSGDYIKDAIEALQYQIYAHKGVIKGNISWIDTHLKEIEELKTKINEYKADCVKRSENIKELEKIIEGLKNEN